MMRSILAFSNDAPRSLSQGTQSALSWSESFSTAAQSKVSKARNTPNSNPAEKAASVAGARRTANSNVREAQYKAAVERCDSLSGAAKDKCVSDAQIKFAQ